MQFKLKKQEEDLKVSTPVFLLLNLLYVLKSKYYILIKYNTFKMDITKEDLCFQNLVLKSHTLLQLE